MHEHQPLERNDPASGFLHAGRESPNERLDVERRGANPSKNSLGISVIDVMLIVTRRFDDRRFKIGISKGRSSGETSGEEAALVFDSTGSPLP